MRVTRAPTAFSLIEAPCNLRLLRRRLNARRLIEVSFTL